MPAFSATCRCVNPLCRRISRMVWPSLFNSADFTSGCNPFVDSMRPLYQTFCNPVDKSTTYRTSVVLAAARRSGQSIDTSISLCFWHAVMAAADRRPGRDCSGWPPLFPET